ncbi:MAG: hypothetical protein ACQET7_01195, partial [Thermodesulfobacteriota bacterium]
MGNPAVGLRAPDSVWATISRALSSDSDLAVGSVIYSRSSCHGRAKASITRGRARVAADPGAVLQEPDEALGKHKGERRGAGAAAPPPPNRPLK